MEAFLYGFTEDGEPKPYNEITGKTKDFDRVISNLFGSPDLILASSFAAQNKRGSFLEMQKIDRKGLFISMLNQELLQRISKECGAELAETDNKLTTKKAQAEVLEDQFLAEVPNIEEMQITLESLEAQCAEYQGDCDHLIELVGKLRAQLERLKPISVRIESEKKRLGEYGAKIAGLKAKIEFNRNILQSADKVKQAVEVLKERRAELDQARKTVSQLSGQHRELQNQKEAHEQKTSKMREDWLREQAAKKAAEKDKEWATNNASAIEDVPCKAEGEFAKCQFLVQAIKGKDDLDRLEVEILNRTQAMLRIQDEQKEISRPDTGALKNIDEQIKTNEDKADQLEKNIKSLEVVASQEGLIHQAQSKIEELLNQIADAQIGQGSAAESVEREQAEYEKLKGAGDELKKISGELEISQHSVNIIRQQIEALKKNIINAEALQCRSKEAEEKLIPLSREIVSLSNDRVEWSLLQIAFGPTGIQSLEIDASGPTISSLANDLLFACFGPRFSIKFVTQVLKADGSGYRDEFDVIVLDSERGREGSVDDLSGGEKVILSEAIGLAVAIFNKMKCGVAWQTLFRDEVTGALDDANAPRYIQMLRQARTIGHFRKVFFIAHQPRLQDLADSRIHMENGIAVNC